LTFTYCVIRNVYRALPYHAENDEDLYVMLDK